MKLMGEAIADVEGVLENPASKIYFKGIKDQALEFDLLYWVSANILVVQSDANLAVHRKLRAGGVKVLLPRKVEIQEQVKPKIQQRKAVKEK